MGGSNDSPPQSESQMLLSWEDISKTEQSGPQTITRFSQTKRGRCIMIMLGALGVYISNGTSR